MKFGDIVVYEENGQEYRATVLASRPFDDHMGADGEPLLHLGFFAPVMGPGPGGKLIEKNVVGTSDQSSLAQFRLDVAHASHEYSEESKLKFGKSYPGGRWSEVPFDGPVPASAGEVPAAESVPAGSAPAAESVPAGESDGA